MRKPSWDQINYQTQTEIANLWSPKLSSNVLLCVHVEQEVEELRDVQSDFYREGVQDGGHMYTHGWFMSVYGKNDYNTVKQLASN